MKTSIKQFIETFFISGLCGYISYIFISYPAMYIIPWIYQLFGLTEWGCGYAIREGLSTEIWEGCSNVQFNIEAMTTGIAVAIASVIIMIIIKKEQLEIE